MSECTCGRRFLDAEDYRDHLPCEGTPALRAQLASARSAALEEAARECESYEDEMRRAYECDGRGRYTGRVATECANRIHALKEKKT